MIEKNNYKLSIDDHCLLVEIGNAKMWLNRQVCGWILNNFDRIGFEESKLLVDVDVSHIFVITPDHSCAKCGDIGDNCDCIYDKDSPPNKT